MTLEDRIRSAVLELHEVGASLTPVVLPSRTTMLRRRAAVGALAAIVAVIVLLMVPGALRQLGIQQVETADQPPAESNQDEGLGTTSEDSGTNHVTTRSGGEGVGGGQQSSERASTRQSSGGQQVRTSVTKPSTPNRAGTYSYSIEGSKWNYVHGRRTIKDYVTTFDQPIGSHQRWREKTTDEDGERVEEEYGFDFRPDGVYLEHYAGTIYTPQGAVVYASACPEIEAMPLRFWPTGTKPGDHLEYEIRCEGGSRRITRDILRSETVSVGGKEVETLYVRGEHRGDYLGYPAYGFHELWIFPDHVLGVKSHHAWSYSCPGCGGGEYWTMLDSMTPQ